MGMLCNVSGIFLNYPNRPRVNILSSGRNDDYFADILDSIYWIKVSFCWLAFHPPPPPIAYHLLK